QAVQPHPQRRDVFRADNLRPLTRHSEARTISVKQVPPPQPDSSDHILGIAPGAAGEPNLEIISTPDAQGRVVITMGRAACQIPAIRLLRHGLKPREDISK